MIIVKKQTEKCYDLALIYYVTMILGHLIFGNSNTAEFCLFSSEILLSGCFFIDVNCGRKIIGKSLGLFGLMYLFCLRPSFCSFFAW